MLTAEGPKLVEINARFGDPECQCILPRLNSDFLQVLTACAKGNVSGIALDWSDESCLTLVMAAKGYPGDYEKDTVIGYVERAGEIEGVEVFHAGTRLEKTVLVSAGGRVLGITALGRDIEQARNRAYDAASQIEWPEGFYRSDIGWRAL